MYTPDAGKIISKSQKNFSPTPFFEKDLRNL